MLRSRIACVVSVALVVMTASAAWARGPGGGGPPGWAGGGGGPSAFAGGGNGFYGTTPRGWSSPGLRRGWVNGQPRGFTKGKKRGWHRGTLSGTVPPGWQR